MNQHIFIWTQRTRRFFAARVAWLTGERGDVPGWVLITLMTAGIVVALWAVAAPALSQLFSTAIDRVVSF
jgi:hypothetical protein